MLKKVLLVALIVITPHLFSLLSQKPETKLPTGVKLTYRATWMGFRAGTGVIQIGTITQRDGKFVIPISSCVSTTGFVRLLLKVDDCLWSWLDPVELIPYRFEEKIREASYSRDRVIEFDRKKKVGRIFRPKEGELVLDKEVPIGEDFHDFMSWTFFLSTQDLRVGQTFAFKILTYQKVDEMSMEVKSKAQISLPKLGKSQAFQIVPSGETGKSIKQKGGSGEVWVDSENRLPLVIFLKIPGAGAIKLTLENIEENGEVAQEVSRQDESSINF